MKLYSMENKYSVFGATNDWGRPGCQGKFGGIGWYRIINPLEKIGAHVERGEFRIGKIESANKMRSCGSTWVVKQMGDLQAWLLILTNARFTGAKLVLDIDDDPFSVDKNHPEYEYHKSHEEMMRMEIGTAAHVIVSTEPLKKVVEKINPNVTVIQNAIDRSIWDFPIKRHKSKRIRLGWIGSGSHMADRDVVKDAMHVIMKKYPQVDFYHAGMCMVDGKDTREFSFKGTKGYEEYPEFLNSLKLDIAIAPIKNTRFNRAKSNIKWLEHSMLKIPMVLSDVTPYSDSVTHGVDGFLAKTTDDWVKYLSMLIESKELREKIGEAANKKVNEEWIIEKQLPKYAKLFQRLMPKNITVYTSVTNGFDDVKPPKFDTAHFVAFSKKHIEGWETRKPYDKFKDERRNSRIQKLMPHLFFETEYSIYLDGNIELLVDPQVLIDEYLKDKDIAAFKHIGRNDVFEEGDAILHYGKETPEAIHEQKEANVKRGMKVGGGLCECGVLIRRHTKEIEQMNERWWAEYCRFSSRDQMSFTYAFPIEKVHQIPGGVYTNKYFKYHNHK